MLQQLQAGDDQTEPSNLVALPRTGDDLANVVSVLLKTADAIESDKDLERLVHQAMVRRDVVVKLIASMKRRRHRAYRHVIMDDVGRRAEALPKDGVPLEIIKLSPLDQLLEQQTNPENCDACVDAAKCARSGCDFGCATMERSCLGQTIALMK